MVNKKSIERFAPLYFAAAKVNLASLRCAQWKTGKYPEFRRLIELFMKAGGLSSADMMLEKYNPIMLKNDEFRVMVILYACVCLITERDELCIPEFREYIACIQDSREISDTADTLKYLSDIVGIDGSIVPEGIKTGMAEIFEEREANKICDKVSDSADGPDGYTLFDGYWDYMKSKANGLINKLVTEGYTHPFTLDLLTHLMILRKLNFPVSDLYSVQMNLPAPRGLIDVLSKKLFEIYKQGKSLPGGGGVIDLSDGFDI